MSQNAYTASALESKPHSKPVHCAGTRTRALGQVARRTVPNLLILLALGGLAYWGHETGWKLPRFASLVSDAGQTKDDWCAEHAVPESVCVECNAALMPHGKSYGWCKLHGVHECPWEHPDVAQLYSPPQVTPADLDRARGALEFADRPANSPKCKMHLRRIQFASDQALARAGVEVTAAWQGAVVESVPANGEITYDPTRVATLSAPVAGKVWQVYKEIGQPVRKGDVLALVDAAAVGKAKGELLQAFALLDVRTKTLKRLRPLEQGGAISAAGVLRAEADFAEAQIRFVASQQALINLGLPVSAEQLQGLSPEQLGRRVQFLGLPDAVVKTLVAQTTTANLVPVVASLDGVVVARKVGIGEQVDASKALFVVADNRQMLLTLQVRQEDAMRLRARDPRSGAAGQVVRFLPGGFDREVVGEVAWVGTAADEKTRTVQVPVALANPTGQLRAGTFGSGRIILRAEKHAIVVPSEAVQWEGDCHVVFVRDKNFERTDAPKVFHTRTVRPGAKDGNLTEIIAGVLPGELVVTKGSGLLRSELLKNNLGEG